MNNRKLWLARLLIAAVFFFNLLCAVQFLGWPQDYTLSFELSGAVGSATIRGFGVLFLMWNVPYAVALWHPQKQRASLWQAVVMQAIGVGGESLIWWGLPSAHTVLAASIGRFIGFDGAGLALLLLAAWLSQQEKFSSS